MSEMTMPDAEAEADETDTSNDGSGETSVPDSGTDAEANPATEKAPNPDGNPDDDRMGAPAMMPD
ncbi:MAG: hypothetical protein V4671_29055 [Armatimonadota bacterium]